MQPGRFWRQVSTFQTVSWGSERTSAGVQKPQAQNLPVLAGSLVRHAPSVVCGYVGLNISRCPYLEHKMDTFWPKNIVFVSCHVAQSRPVGLQSETALHQHQDEHYEYRDAKQTT